MTTSTHLVPFGGSLVAVKIMKPDGARVSFTLANPTDDEIEKAAAADPKGIRQLADYLKEHNKDGGAYKRLKIGFGAED